MGARALELFCAWQLRVERRESDFLSLGHRGHQTQVVADRLANRSGRAQLPQTPRPRSEQPGSFRQSDPRHRPRGERLNLTGLEDARHD